MGKAKPRGGGEGPEDGFFVRDFRTRPKNPYNLK